MLAIPLVLIVAGYVIYLRKYKISGKANSTTTICSPTPSSARQNRRQTADRNRPLGSCKFRSIFHV